MSDLISRSALLEEMKRMKMDNVAKATAIKTINWQPTVEAIPKEKLQEIVERLEKLKIIATTNAEWSCRQDDRYHETCHRVRAATYHEVLQFVRKVGGVMSEIRLPKIEPTNGRFGEIKNVTVYVCEPQKYVPTNAERIRSMTDEELAKIIECPYQTDEDEYEEPNCDGKCYECCLKWLKEEVE